MSKEHNEELIRLQAVLENLRKEYAQHDTEARQRGVEDAIRMMAPVFDDFGRLSAYLSNDVSSDIQKGVMVLRESFRDAFQKLGVVRIQTEGTSYDPKFHETIGEEETEEHPPDTIVREQSAGWMWKETEEVIVPARVIIAKQSN